MITHRHEGNVNIEAEFFFFFNKSFKVNEFWAVLGLHCCVQAFSSCSKQGLPSSCGMRLFIVVASLVVEHRLLGHAGSRSCGVWAQKLQLPGRKAQAQ